jgi:formylglycine-generating enzyme required for sulfatase activity
MLAVASLLLIHPQVPTTLAQVGADKRPAPTPSPKKITLPKINTSKTQPKRTTTHSTSSSTPRQVQCIAQSPTRGTGNDYSESLSGGVRLEMIGIPAGSFCMGSPAGKGEDYEHPQHKVTVAAFYMGKYEVTQAQWRAVMGTNPSNFKGDDLPVENVSWDEAQEFCRKLSQMTGHEYRLPTEAEWEYAARSGTTGDYAGNLDAMGWYDANAGRRTHPVGQKQANGFGLYDMHGNVFEWVQDWYGTYQSGEVMNPQGSGSGSTRVFRGGSWYYTAAHCRSTFRYGYSPGYHDINLGFRLVRTLR